MNTMEFDAFISYSSTDKTAALAACAVLEGAGIRCWIAPRDIRPGGEYGAAIIDAIERCRVMVLIFSSSANSSRQITREIERAVSKGVPIVPVRIEAVQQAEENLACQPELIAHGHHIGYRPQLRRQWIVRGELRLQADVGQQAG